MKILVIADLHGLNVWKKMVDDKYDRIVFLGDYVDSFIVPDSEMVKNLQDILAYKRANPERVILLLGNHDVQYFNKGCGCSGYRSSIAPILKLLYTEAEKEGLFKIVHKEEGYIFSHSGFTHGWLKYHEEDFDNYFPDGFLYDEIELLNNILLSHDKKILFECGGGRGGYDSYSGPIWADKSETYTDGHLDDFIQIVGHTPVPKITKLPHIIYCDTLEHGDGIPLIIDTNEE